MSMRVMALVAGLLIASAPLFGQEARPVWQTGWDSAFRIARDEHRLVFVNYTASWCGECHDVERLTFQSELLQILSGLVLLQVDVDRSAIPREYRRRDLPAYIVYDAAGRERFHLVGKGAASYLGAKNLETIRGAAPAFVRAAELLEAKKDLEAAFLVAHTYSRMKMGSYARDAYAKARSLAEKGGDRAAAQLADVQSAFTFALEGDPAQAVKRLGALAKAPVDRDSEALIWLTLGRAHEAAKETKAALESYQHAQSLAPRDSRTYVDAGAAMARLQ
jgi:tetratricopeptide (TPR) repeat protein